MVKVKIDDEACFKCGFCMLFNLCPRKAIKRDCENLEAAQNFYIDLDQCNGCLKCIDADPCNAFFIEVEGEKLTSMKYSTFDLQRLEGVVPLIKKTANNNINKANSLFNINYINENELPTVEFNYKSLITDLKESSVQLNSIKIMLIWGGEFEFWAKCNELSYSASSTGEQIFVMIPSGYNYGIRMKGKTQGNIVEIVELNISQKNNIDNAAKESSTACKQIIIKREKDIEFVDGPISIYGKYMTKEEISTFDFQSIKMKANSEDAHVHDKEIEIMLLWGGEFEVWTKGLAGTRHVKSKGEKTCVMIPPGYAHGVKNTGNKPLDIAITYIPAIDKWP